MSPEIPRVQTEDAAASAAQLKRVSEAVSSYFVGHEDIVEKLLAAVLAKGHVLFEDYPGLGKTLLVKTLSKAIESDFHRVQFTPDVLPSDILGTRIWEPSEREFVFKQGPIFTNILLADEINRAPPKTQSALLEAMEERQATVDGTTLTLPQPFFVLATQNPIEQEGTYPLPEAQMDRFLLRLQTGYPESEDHEREILRRRITWRQDDPTERIEPVLTLDEFAGLQRAAEEVFVHEDVLGYISKLVRALRAHPDVEVGPSPRGALALLKASRAMALLQSRTFVIPDDVKDIASEALAHRTILKVEQLLEGADPSDAVQDVIRQTPAPTPKRKA